MRFAAGKTIGAGKVARIHQRNSQVGMNPVEGVRQNGGVIHHGRKGREKRAEGQKGGRDPEPDFYEISFSIPSGVVMFLVIYGSSRSSF